MSSKLFKSTELAFQMNSDRSLYLKEEDYNKFYETVLNTIPGLIWIKDLNGTYVFCNNRLEEYLGTNKLNIQGKTTYDFTDRESADLASKYDQEVIRKETPVVSEEWITCAKTGQKEFLEVKRIPMYNNQDGLIGVLGITRDITARQVSEEKLRQSEERFSLAMRGANDGLWDWNLETDEVYYSPRWKSMLGYGDDELTNDLSTWKNLVHPEDQEMVLKMVQEYLTSAIKSFEVEMRMQHKQGHEVFVLSRAFLVHRDSDRKAIRLVGTHVDITAIKKAEEFDNKQAKIMEMIATGKPASKIYSEIALMYEARHPGLRCSMLELEDGRLLHGGAPSLPKEYCEAVHGLKNGPNVGSCGTSTYTGRRVLVENIDTDPKWSKIKHVALPHGMRCCWSEPIKDSTGFVLGAFGMYYDYPALPNEEESNDLTSAARLAGIVMERDHIQKRIKQLAYNDELTGLASRAYFYQNLEEFIKSFPKNQSKFCLLYIDLDNFKGVNDSLGHDAGDLLLQEIANRLKMVTRDLDFVARLSGDEFCVLVNDLDGHDTSRKIAQRCLEAISKPLTLMSRKFTPTCSIGIAHYPEDGQDASTLVKAADTSLYAAKEKGKNQCAFYRAELTQKAEYQFQMEHYLREAIENQQLSLVYQPKVQISTNEIIGVEALCRWFHPQLGQVSPVEFIALAEKIGMIKPLTEWVLRTACNQAIAWKKAGLPEIQMAVNISPVHFLDPDFVSFIRQILAETQIIPSNLELEVTERVVQTDPQNLSIFRELKKLGVALAIDDFGTGYSSFASLKHITIDCLKIDKYFIDDMLSDRKSHILVSSMIEMGLNLNYEIIAEGVETVDQCNKLHTLGCETAQGYLFSRPENPDIIAKLLQKSS